MFKPLLIHKDNTPIKNICQNSLIFSIDNFDFGNSDLDSFISKEFLPKLNQKDFNIIFIKDNLSNNYLELYGLILAYHIRLSIELGDKRFVPIVIISDVNGYILNKLTPMANILFTKNTFVARNEISSYDYFKKVFEQIKPFSDFKKEFLDLINIDPPRDYLSHHDISNEWSIFRWAEFLKVDTDAVKANKVKIENMLYFKYLKEKNPIPKKNGLSIVPKSPYSQGNILYIDDEWEKGWADIFKKYFSKSENIKLSVPKFQYKDSSYLLIEEMVKQQLNSDLYDLILLDLRLTNEDHEQQNENEFSGIKLLSFIKSFNPGTQVILLTASEKSKVLNKANEYNILGYIKKESPKDDIAYSKEVFKKLTAYINNGLEKKYLKDIWNIQQDILKLDILNQEKFNQIKIEIKFVFEILQSDMNNRFIYSLFSIFKAIEIIIDFYIEEKFEGKNRFAYWKGINEKLKIVKKDEYFPKEIKSDDKNDSTLNKIRVILYERLDLKDKKIHDNLINLVEVRNNTIHPEKNKNFPKIDQSHICLWFNNLLDILIKINKIDKI